MPLAFGEIVTGSIEASDCAGSIYLSDRYALSGSVGQEVSIRLSSENLGYTELKLKLPSGQEIRSDYISPSDEKNTIEIVVTLPASGEFVVEVGASSSTLGDYQVSATLSRLCEPCLLRGHSASRPPRPTRCPSVGTRCR